MLNNKLLNKLNKASVGIILKTLYNNYFVLSLTRCEPIHLKYV